MRTAFDSQVLHYVLHQDLAHLTPPISLEPHISTFDRNESGCEKQLFVDITLLSWLSALRAIWLGRQNMNRKLVHATRLISVKRVRGERERESEEAGIAAAARKFYSLRSPDE